MGKTETGAVSRDNSVEFIDVGVRNVTPLNNPGSLRWSLRALRPFRVVRLLVESRVRVVLSSFWVMSCIWSF